MTTLISQVAAQSNTVTLGSHQAGDIILVFAYRDNNNNTAPSLPAGFTNLQQGGANGNSARLAWKLATSSSDTVGTWTNANFVIAAVYRGGIIGNSSQAGGSSQNTTFPAVTITTGSTGSRIVAFAGNRSRSATLENSPTDMVNRTLLRGAEAINGAVAMYDSNNLVTSWSSRNTVATAFNVAFRTAMVEIRPRPPSSGTALFWAFP